jgi:hypothetical protein
MECLCTYSQWIPNHQQSPQCSLRVQPVLAPKVVKLSGLGLRVGPSLSRSKVDPLFVPSPASTLSSMLR